MFDLGYVDFLRNEQHGIRQGISHCFGQISSSNYTEAYLWSRVLCRGGGVAIQKLKREPRDTREGWPLLTVETEANGESKSTNESGPPSLVGSLGSSQEIFVLTNPRVIIDVEGPLS